MIKQADQTPEEAIYETETEENNQKSQNLDSDTSQSSDSSNDDDSVTNSQEEPTMSPIKDEKECFPYQGDQSQSEISSLGLNDNQKKGSGQNVDQPTSQGQKIESTTIKTSTTKFVKLTSQASFNQDSNGEIMHKNSQNKKDDLIIYFGDQDQQALNLNKKLQNKVRTQLYSSSQHLFSDYINLNLFSIFSKRSFVYDRNIFDYQRYKQDKEVNNKISLVLNPQTLKFESKKWEDVEVGNIVKFLKDQEAPADIAVIISSSKSGVVNVDTMNLDGETNLKEKQALLENIEEKDVQVLHGQLKCDQPNENLDKWEGKFKFDYGEIKAPLASIKNLLLRGCFVRNTDFGIGINGSQNLAGRYFLQLIVYWVAYSHMIPISLYVIIEVLKLGVATFISKDLMMFDKETDCFARCRNSDLIEELGRNFCMMTIYDRPSRDGMVIFTKMRYNLEFQINQQEENKDGMAVSGIKEIRNFFREEIDERKQLGEKATYPYVTEFLINLALCNTVVCDPNRSKKEESYKASSPDELALVKAAKSFGVQLVSRQHNKITLFNMISREIFEYKLIAEFPFDSVRKRMSVIVKDRKNKTYSILCKGADSVMLNRISYEKNGIQDIREIIEEDLFDFSSEGLRTLMLTKRTINREEYQNFKNIYQQIQESSSFNKEQRLAQLYEAMEQKLRYIGCTAIEDKLQEGVPITIKKLLEADIRFFMLTGDKLETAIEIAKSCQVIQDDMKVQIIGKPVREKILKKLNRLISIFNIDPSWPVKCLQDIAQENQVITVEGSCLTLILEDEKLAHLFFHVAIRSKSVVCCRMSPKQKADVVNLFKSRGKWITLAIGDGANDVSMIMEAHIGVGIRGKEGTQAVRLILLHGRNGYLRVSQMICYYFYKNIVLVFTELYFAFYNGFSGQIYFLDWLPMLYNAFFTSWHCLFSQFLEKDINEHYSYQYPVIYKVGQLGLYFNFRVFWKWILLSIWHGVTGITSSTTDENGQRSDHWLHSTISFTIIIHLVFYKLLLETRHFNLITFFTGVGSMMLYYGILLLSQIAPISYVFQPQILGLVNRMVIYPQYWLMIIAVPFVCLIPDFFIKLISKIFYPTPVDIVLLAQKNDPLFDFDDTLRDLDEIQIEQKIKVQTEQEQRKKSVLEIKKNTLELGLTTDPVYQKQASHVNLSHLRSQRSREESKRQNSASSKGKNYPDFDDELDVSHKYIKGEYEKTIPEVDEDEITENDDSISSSNSSDDDNETKLGKNKQSHVQIKNDEEKNNDDQNITENQKSPIASKSSRSIDQSFRSNRGLIKKQSGKNISEIRDSKRSEKKTSIVVKKQISKLELDQQQVPSGRSRKSKKDNNINSSLFSVSDQSRMDLMNDRDDNKRNDAEYIGYFEDLNKEIVEKTKNQKNFNKDSSKQENNTIPLEQRKSISVNEKQVKNYNKKKQKDQERRSKRLSQQELPEEDDNQVKNLQEQKMPKPLNSVIFDDNNQIKTQLQVESFHAQQDRPQTSIPISKDSFRMILGKRSQDLFMINTNSEIPKSRIVKPQSIVDKISVKTTLIEDNIVSVQQQQRPISYMLQGHPLEQSCIPSVFSENESNKRKNTSRKKAKKYVQKYSNNSTNNNSNNFSHLHD
ncbi:p-type atpase [Stylonychia lemnae]|uniref:Phospholipid-transporting ATPase n=1 Tax=Stylonychia lemnae TaxID=5949 RepID=A0A078A0G8_STYLE|nr:p-type atpase [Stylonychia lemnae]|eukprot:CDW75337.1 p-type atpase [Stylonychia lemnae]